MTIYLKDLPQTGRRIPILYIGEHKVHLEGSIFKAGKKELEIGISLFEEDVIGSKFDERERTLHIEYRHYDGVRIAVLPMTRFSVPASLEKVIISEVKK